MQPRGDDLRARARSWADRRLQLQLAGSSGSGAIVAGGGAYLDAIAARVGL